MVTVTPRASKLLDTIDRPAGTVLRLEPTQGAQGVALMIGSPQPDDLVVEGEGTDLLHIAAAISDLLDGLTIDEVDTEQGPALTIARPDA